MRRCPGRDPGVRFYARYPLVTDGDERIGSLCILELAPRQSTAMQQRALQLSRVNERETSAGIGDTAIARLLDKLSAQRDEASLVTITAVRQSKRGESLREYKKGRHRLWDHQRAPVRRVRLFFRKMAVKTFLQMDSRSWRKCSERYCIPATVSSSLRNFVARNRKTSASVMDAHKNSASS